MPLLEAAFDVGDEALYEGEPHTIRRVEIMKTVQGQVNTYIISPVTHRYHMRGATEAQLSPVPVGYAHDRD